MIRSQLWLKPFGNFCSNAGLGARLGCGRRTACGARLTGGVLHRTYASRTTTTKQTTIGWGSVGVQSPFARTVH
eukprot:10569350-Heterocapsa_arctica.AAC.1